MHAWEAISKATDTIEEHLKDGLQTEMLAKEAGLSPFYFQRLFKRLVKRTVGEYVKLRRLSAVVKELEQSGRRILDIALDYGFSSHSNFTRAFKEAYGLTPEEFRKTRPRLNTFERPELSMDYTLIDEGVPLIAGNIVLELNRRRLIEAQTYLGLAARVRTSEQAPMGECTGIDMPGQLWDSYHRKMAELAGIILTDQELGMSHQADPEAGSFTYFAGGLCASGSSEPPKGFVKQELPAGEYLVCTIEGESFEELVTAALDQAGRYLFGTWLPGHKLTTYPFSAEKYYKNVAGVQYMELWVKPRPL